MISSHLVRQLSCAACLAISALPALRDDFPEEGGGERDFLAEVDDEWMPVDEDDWFMASSWLTHDDYVEAEWPFTYDYGLLYLDESQLGDTNDHVLAVPVHRHRQRRAHQPQRRRHSQRRSQQQQHDDAPRHE